MRKETTTREQPARTHTLDIWRCDEPGCGFETEDEREAREHQGCRHAAKAKQSAGGELFYWFDTREDAIAFLSTQYDGAYEEKTRWEGPGWYGIRCYNAATDYDPSYALPAAEIAARKRKKASGLISEADEIGALSGTGKTPAEPG